jgi:UDP-N-acetylglucosamine 2-epimerase (non-hydrolysing)
VHPNPQVRETAGQELAEAERVTLIKPPNYLEFVALMQRAYLILTDSGGVQEEAPALGVPALVMRDTSERPEGLACGSAELVGTSTERIVRAARRLLTEEAEYQRRRLAPCPYGDGKAAQRIVDALGFHFGSQPQRPADWEVTG